MRYVTSFDPSASKTGIINVGIADAGQKLLLQNLSAVNLLINFDDGTSDVLFAGQGNYWTLENITPEILWSQESVLSVTNIPISACKVIIYNVDEKVEGTYPTSLVYFSTVGNPGGINTNVSGTGTDLINDGQAVGHTYIESTPQGQVASSYTLTNDGLMVLKTLVSGSYLQMFKTQVSGNSPQIGNSTVSTEVMGALIVDGVTTHTGTVTANAINATNLSASGTLSVTGVSTFSGQVNAPTVSATGLQSSGILSVTGASTLTGTVTANQINASGLTATGTVQGTTLVSNALNDTGGSGILSVTAGTTTRVQSPVTVVVQIPAGTPQLTINSSGATFAGNLTANGTVTLGAVGASSLSTGTFQQTGVTTSTFAADIDMQGHTIQDCNVINATDGNSWVAVTAGTVTRIQNPTAVVVQVPGGSSRLTVNSTDVIAGVQFTAPKYILSGSTGNYGLYKNSLSRISNGTWTSNGSFQTINHNLGAVPTLVMIGCADSASTATNTIDPSSYTSTTFSAKCFATGVVMQFLAIRY